MIVEFKSNESQRAMKQQLTDDEWNAVNDAINAFEDANPRRKKILIDMDFIIPLIHGLRSDKKNL